MTSIGLVLTTSSATTENYWFEKIKQLQPEYHLKDNSPAIATLINISKSKWIKNEPNSDGLYHCIKFFANGQPKAEYYNDENYKIQGEYKMYRIELKGCTNYAVNNDNLFICKPLFAVLNFKDSFAVDGAIVYYNPMPLAFEGSPTNDQKDGWRPNMIGTISYNVKTFHWDMGEETGPFKFIQKKWMGDCESTSTYKSGEIDHGLIRGTYRVYENGKLTKQTYYNRKRVVNEEAPKKDHSKHVLKKNNIECWSKDHYEMTNMSSLTTKKHKSGVFSSLEDYSEGVITSMIEFNKHGQVTREMRDKRHLIYQMSNAMNARNLYDKRLLYVLTKAQMFYSNSMCYAEGMYIDQRGRVSYDGKFGFVGNSGFAPTEGKMYTYHYLEDGSETLACIARVTNGLSKCLARFYSPTGKMVKIAYAKVKKVENGFELVQNNTINDRDQKLHINYDSRGRFESQVLQNVQDGDKKKFYKVIFDVDGHVEKRGLFYYEKLEDKKGLQFEINNETGEQIFDFGHFKNNRREGYHLIFTATKYGETKLDIELYKDNKKKPFLGSEKPFHDEIEKSKKKGSNQPYCPSKNEEEIEKKKMLEKRKELMNKYTPKKVEPKKKPSKVDEGKAKIEQEKSIIEHEKAIIEQEKARIEQEAKIQKQNTIETLQKMPTVQKNFPEAKAWFEKQNFLDKFQSEDKTEESEINPEKKKPTEKNPQKKEEKISTIKTEKPGNPADQQKSKTPQKSTTVDKNKDQKETKAKKTENLISESTKKVKPDKKRENKKKASTDSTKLVDEQIKNSSTDEKTGKETNLNESKNDEASEKFQEIEEKNTLEEPTNQDATEKSQKNEEKVNLEESKNEDTIKKSQKNDQDATEKLQVPEENNTESQGLPESQENLKQANFENQVKNDENSKDLETPEKKNDTEAKDTLENEQKNDKPEFKPQEDPKTDDKKEATDLKSLTKTNLPTKQVEQMDKNPEKKNTENLIKNAPKTNEFQETNTNTDTAIKKQNEEPKIKKCKPASKNKPKSSLLSNLIKNTEEKYNKPREKKTIKDLKPLEKPKEIKPRINTTVDEAQKPGRKIVQKIYDKNKEKGWNSFSIKSEVKYESVYTNYGKIPEKIFREGLIDDAENWHNSKKVEHDEYVSGYALFERHDSDEEKIESQGEMRTSREKKQGLKNMTKNNSVINLSQQQDSIIIENQTQEPDNITKTLRILPGNKAKIDNTTVKDDHKKFVEEMKKNFKKNSGNNPNDITAMKDNLNFTKRKQSENIDAKKENLKNKKATNQPLISANKSVTRKRRNPSISIGKSSLANSQVEQLKNGSASLEQSKLLSSGISAERNSIKKSLSKSQLTKSNISDNNKETSMKPQDGLKLSKRLDTSLEQKKIIRGISNNNISSLKSDRIKDTPKEVTKQTTPSDKNIPSVRLYESGRTSARSKGVKTPINPKANLVKPVSQNDAKRNVSNTKKPITEASTNKQNLQPISEKKVPTVTVVSKKPKQQNLADKMSQADRLSTPKTINRTPSKPNPEENTKKDPITVSDLKKPKNFENNNNTTSPGKNTNDSAIRLEPVILRPKSYKTATPVKDQQITDPSNKNSIGNIVKSEQNLNFKESHSTFSKINNNDDFLTENPKDVPTSDFDQALEKNNEVENLIETNKPESKLVESELILDSEQTNGENAKPDSEKNEIQTISQINLSPAKDTKTEEMVNEIMNKLKNPSYSETKKTDQVDESVNTSEQKNLQDINLTPAKDTKTKEMVNNITNKLNTEDIESQNENPKNLQSNDEKSNINNVTNESPQKLSDLQDINDTRKENPTEKNENQQYDLTPPSHRIEHIDIFVEEEHIRTPCNKEPLEEIRESLDEENIFESKIQQQKITEADYTNQNQSIKEDLDEDHNKTENLTEDPNKTENLTEDPNITEELNAQSVNAKESNLMNKGSVDSDNKVAKKASDEGPEWVGIGKIVQKEEEDIIRKSDKRITTERRNKSCVNMQDPQISDFQAQSDISPNKVKVQAQDSTPIKLSNEDSTGKDQEISGEADLLVSNISIEPTVSTDPQTPNKNNEDDQDSYDSEDHKRKINMQKKQRIDKILQIKKNFDSIKKGKNSKENSATKSQPTSARKTKQLNNSAANNEKTNSDAQNENTAKINEFNLEKTTEKNQKDLESTPNDNNKNKQNITSISQEKTHNSNEKPKKKNKRENLRSDQDLTIINTGDISTQDVQNERKNDEFDPNVQTTSETIDGHSYCPSKNDVSDPNLMETPKKSINSGQVCVSIEKLEIDKTNIDTNDDIIVENIKGEDESENYTENEIENVSRNHKRSDNYDHKSPKDNLDHDQNNLTNNNCLPDNKSENINSRKSSDDTNIIGMQFSSHSNKIFTATSQTVIDKPNMFDNETSPEKNISPEKNKSLTDNFSDNATIENSSNRKNLHKTSIEN